MTDDLDPQALLDVLREVANGRFPMPLRPSMMSWQEKALAAALIEARSELATERWEHETMRAAVQYAAMLQETTEAERDAARTEAATAIRELGFAKLYLSPSTPKVIADGIAAFLAAHAFEDGAAALSTGEDPAALSPAVPPEPTDG